MAGVVINEVMYDLKEGSDTGREWVEVLNNGSEAVDMAGWKLFEADTNHGLTIHQGENILPVGGYAIIVSDPAKFLIDWPGLQGTIFDSSFSLSNSGETLILRNGELADIDNISYSSDMGANGDGNSLQKTNGQWSAVTPTLNTQNTGSQSSQSQSQPSQQESSSSSSWPVEPQIYADAGVDKTAVAGADIVFTGQALGLDKKPLDGARYLWSFGDGASTEGKSVKHFYKYPGEHILFLNVSSGEYSAGDSALIKVVPNQLKIIEANDDFIKLKNDSNVTLDVSGWFLKSGDKLFKFPQTTLIKNSATLIIDSSISGINTKDGKAELLYPNGSLAVSYQKSEIKSEPVKITEEAKVSIFEPEIKIPENKITETQIANVADSVKIDKSSNLNKWLMLVLGFGVISGAGFVFIKNGIKK